MDELSCGALCRNSNTVTFIEVGISFTRVRKLKEIRYTDDWYFSLYKR